MSRRRDAGIVVALFALLCAGSVAIARLAPQTPGPSIAYSTYSAAPDGLMALKLWATDLGYVTTTIEDEPFAPMASQSTMFVVEPSESFTAVQAHALLDWVRQGHVLVYASSSVFPDAVYQALHVNVVGGAQQKQPSPVQPLLLRPPVRHLTAVDAPSLAPDIAYVGLVPAGSGSGYLVVREQQGRGTVFVLSVPALLTNRLLPKNDNRRLVANVLALMPNRSTVAFDEYHHGFIRVHAKGAFELLMEHVWGRTVVLLVLAAFAYVALTGRRLGRPVAVAGTKPRTLHEYIVALASLWRRAGARVEVQRRYQRRLRWALSDRYHAPFHAGSRALLSAMEAAGAEGSVRARAAALLDASAPRNEAALLAAARASRELEEDIRR